MDRRQVQSFKNELLKNKQRLTEEISNLERTGLGDTMADSVGELSVYDNHPADIGDELFERSKDVALKDNAHILLEQAESALERIEAGTYGVCEACGRDIPLERLQVMPEAAYCVACQQVSDGREISRRPVEEDVLAPPFGRTFLDGGGEDFVGFDGEDALQAVLRYGSSDTPQDLPGTHDYTDLFPNSNEHAGIVEKGDAIPAEPGSST